MATAAPGTTALASRIASAFARTFTAAHFVAFYHDFPDAIDDRARAHLIVPHGALRTVHGARWCRMQGVRRNTRDYGILLIGPPLVLIEPCRARFRPLTKPQHS
jgi:hypothetical protein